MDDNLRRAAGAMSIRRFDEAERLAREAIAARPNDAEALKICGLAVLAQNRPQDAIAPLERAAATLSDPVVEINLAKALRQSGREDDAVNWLERATGRQPPVALAFLELGVTFFLLHKLEEAEATLLRGLAIAPGMPEMSLALGGVLQNLGDRAGANAAYARVLTAVPGHPAALFSLGELLMEEGNFSEAAARYRQVLARNPSHAEAWLDLGRCELEAANWDEAVKCLRNAVKIAPQLYGRAAKAFVASGHGRFWLRPSAIADVLLPKDSAR